MKNYRIIAAPPNANFSSSPMIKEIARFLTYEDALNTIKALMAEAEKRERINFSQKWHEPDKWISSVGGWLKIDTIKG